ncbi:uncharacterized protein LOC131948325 [Physella acuta]|uniref:uncharacterized protein LOC131948325 n=1 Tax=Physella acuta TaxID=109671 RepID=UPI0027DC1489|nr:uncharacterized protein LOC131948325 [Physella acuta]
MSTQCFNSYCCRDRTSTFLHKGTRPSQTGETMARLTLTFLMAVLYVVYVATAYEYDRYRFDGGGYDGFGDSYGRMGYGRFPYGGMGGFPVPYGGYHHEYMEGHPYA